MFVFSRIMLLPACFSGFGRAEARSAKCDPGTGRSATGGRGLGGHMPGRRPGICPPSPPAAMLPAAPTGPAPHDLSHASAADHRRRQLSAAGLAGRSRGTLHQHGVPRIHAHDIWRIAGALLEQAQDDATILAIRDMERAGIDIVTDGEIRRESYSNRFALALDGIDAEHPGEVRSQSGRDHPGAARGRQDPPPRAGGACATPSSCCATPTAPPRSRCPARSPCRSRLQNEFYADEAEMAMDYAVAVNEELRDLKATGRRRGATRRALGAHRAGQGRRATASRAINRALRGHRGPDRRASLLRLRRGGAEQAERLQLPAAACRYASPRRSRSRRRSRSSTSACCATCPASRSCSACSISAIPRWRPPSRSPRGSARR